AGLSCEAMKQSVEEVLSTKSARLKQLYNNTELNFALAFLDPTMKPGGLIKGDKFIQFLYSKMQVKRFEELEIPFLAVATHYWRREQVVFAKGNLLKAVQASYSMPGLFTPVSVGNDLYVDGGLVNPLPYDILRPRCDITVAVNVAIHSIPRSTGSLHAQEILFSAFQVMQNSIVREKLRQAQPDIHIRIETTGVRTLEFHKRATIFEQALASKEGLKQKLIPLLD
ncbi:MAG TPA: patatin-like phospholipase family protein, partial [Terriglobia bacterium]|nr:patatin-like phospholipase family protein [Terriglobia bacterium]